MGLVLLGDCLLQSKVPCYVGTTGLRERIQGKFGVLLHSVPFDASGRSQRSFEELKFCMVKLKDSFPKFLYSL